MRFCTLIVLALTFSAVSGQEDSVKEEMKKLQGKWAQVVVEANGNKHTDTVEAPKVTLTISGEKWIETPVGQVAEEDACTFKINPAKEPKQLDIIDKTEGKDKAFTFPGIYMLKGDTLTIAVPFAFEHNAANIDKRPTEFRTKFGDDVVVITYRRIKS